MKPLEKAFSNSASPGSFACSGCYCMCACVCNCVGPAMEEVKWDISADWQDEFRDDRTSEIHTY